MITVNFTIPDQYESLVIEMLRKTSGKDIKLSCDLISVPGSFTYEWKTTQESDDTFVVRALKAMVKGLIKWGILVKETQRYEVESKRATQIALESVKPITVNVPDDVL